MKYKIYYSYVSDDMSEMEIEETCLRFALEKFYSNQYENKEYSEEIKQRNNYIPFIKDIIIE